MYIIPILLITPMLTISLSSWFTIWFCLELNLMAFIPLMSQSSNFHKESNYMYFMIQSYSSSILLISSNLLNMTLNNSPLIILLNLTLNCSILIKMGAAPFHTWFIHIMKNLNWTMCFLISTWQKLTPLIILTYCLHKNLSYLIILISLIISNIFGLKHNSIQLIMGYSSLNQLSWLIFTLMINKKLFIAYFLFYLISNFNLMFLFNQMNYFFINQISLTDKYYKFILFFNMINLTMLPPTLNFTIKWFSIFKIIDQTSHFTILFMMIMSIFSFFFYTRMTLTLLLTSNINIKSNLLTTYMNKYKMNHFFSMLILSFLNIWMINNWIF